MNKAYKIIWNKARECYVVVAEFAKTRSKSSSRSLSLLMTTGVLLSLLTGSAFASGTATVTGTSGTDELVTIQGGTDISVTENNGVITIGAVYDPTLETLRKYIKFNADYDSGTSLPSVAANSANSFVWGKNAGVYVYSLAEKSEKNIAIGAGSKIYAGNMGNPSKGTGSNTAIGADSSVGSNNNIYGTYDTVVGAGAKAYGGSNVVVGNSQAGLNQQIGTKSDGTKIWANVDNAVVVGSGAAAYSDKATAVGGAAIAGKKPTRTDYTDRSQAENAKITYTTAVGYGAHAFGMNSTAVGAQTVATGQQNISLGSGSEARKDNTMSVGFHAIASAADATAIGHDAVVFGDGGLAIGHLVFTGMPALEGYRNNNLDESYIASPEGMRIAGDSKIYFRTEDGTVLKYEVKIGQNGEEDGKYYKVKAVQTGNSWKFVKVNAAGEEVADTSPDAVQYVAKETMKKDTRTSSKVNHIDYFYIAGQEASSKIYPTDEGVAIGTYVSTEGSRAMAIGMSSTAHDANNTALGLYSNTFGKDATAIGHASLSGARGLIETNANTGEHTISYQVTKQGVSERTTIDGTVVPYDKNFAYEFSDGTNTLKVQNGKIVAVGDNAYTQTGIKLASDNTAVYRDDETGYLYYTKSGAKHLVKPDEDVIINGSGGTLTVSAGKMMLSNGGLAIGSYTHAEGDKSVAFGNASGASGRNSVAVGKFANAYGEGSIAFGSDAVAGAEVTTNVDGHKVLAITNKTGQPVMENGKPVSGAVAFGNYAHATANNSLAFGTDAEATAKNSVAIGSGSVSDVEDTVSVGSANKTRTIVHVTAGVDDTDAVNVSQLKSKADKNLDNIDSDGKAVIVGLTDVVSGDSIVTVTPNTDADGKKTYTITAAISGDGVVEEGNTGLVTGGVVYDAMMAESRPASNGNYITTDNTAGANLTALDNQVKANADDIANLDTVKANTGLDNITDDGKTVVRTLAQESVKMVDGTNTTVTEGTDGVAKTYAVNVTVDGVVEQDNTGIVSGGTVYNALQAETRPVQDGNYITTTNTAGQNLTALDSQVKTNADDITDINTALDTKANADASNVSANTAQWGAAIGTGVVEANNAELVTGGTVYTETHPAFDGNYITAAGTAGANLTALDTQVKTNADAIETLNTSKANVSLDNITDAGRTVIQNATNIVSGDDIISVTPTTENGVKTYTVTANITADGQVEDGNTGLVTGNTVYQEVRPADGNYVSKDATTAENLSALDTAIKTNKDTIDDINTSLDTKANTDASNLTGHEAEWGAAIGTGNVESNNGELVTGGTVYNALMSETRPDADGNYISANNTTGDNLTVLDTAVKNNADAITDLGNNKANISLDNINDDGKAVITGLTEVKASGIGIGVTPETDATGKKTYTVALQQGEIAQDNNGVVTGGQIYDYVEPLRLRPGDNIVIEDGEISAVGFIKYDEGSNKSMVTLEGTRGTKITNVKPATISRTSSDAVIGNQLWTTNQNVEGLRVDIHNNLMAIAELNNSMANITSSVASVNSLVNTLDTLKADASLNNLTENGQTVITSIVNNAVEEYIRDNGFSFQTSNGKVIDDENGLKENKISKLRVMLQKDIDDTDDTKANVSLDNLDEAGQNTVRDIAKSSIDVKGEGAVTVNKETVDNTDTFTVKVNADGKIEEGNEGLVTGDTVFKGIQSKADKSELETKANVDLDNITDKGKESIRDAVKEDLDKKADADASNINIDAWSEKLATGTVEEGNTGLVNGDAVFKAIENRDGMVSYSNDTVYIAPNKEGTVVDIRNASGEGRVITGVETDPEDMSSAANVGYVNQVKEDLHQEFGHLNGKIDRVGANAAALASLEPVPYDGDQKWNISAAFGNYRSETAGAVGVFYRPQENLMFNLRSSFGSSGENLIGGGVSLALDRTKSEMTKAQMAEHIKSQDEKIARLEKMVIVLSNKLEAVSNK